MLENIKDWHIKPYEGIGDLKLGSHRLHVRKFLGQEFTNRRSWRVSRDNIDLYDNAIVQLHYDRNDLLVFIEVNPPCDPTFKCIHFMGLQLQYVLEQMESFGYNAIFEEAISCRFETIGIALYAPSLSGIIEAVSVYQRGLYENGEEVYEME